MAILSEFSKGRIIQLKKENNSEWVIKKKLQNDWLNVSVRNINQVYQNYLNNDQNSEMKVGRPPSMSEEQTQKIREAVIKNKDMTAVKIQKSRTLNPNNVSLSTIQRLLKTQGFKSVVAPKKPFISPLNVQKRLNFAYELLDRRLNEIEKIVFSDESKLFPQQCDRKFLKILKGKKIPKKYYRLQEKYHGGLEILVWGVISRDGGIKLRWIKDKLYAESYIELLETELLPLNSQENEIIFMQYNGGPHRSIKVKKYIEENDVDMFDWPSQSPYLNPIEHVWAFLKNFLYEKRQKIATKEDVFKFALQGFDTQECENLIRNMYKNYKNRLEEVIMNEGYQTRH